MILVGDKIGDLTPRCKSPTSVAGTAPLVGRATTSSQAGVYVSAMSNETTRMSLHWLLIIFEELLSRLVPHCARGNSTVL